LKFPSWLAVAIQLPFGPSVTATSCPDVDVVYARSLSAALARILWVLAKR